MCIRDRLGPWLGASAVDLRARIRELNCDTIASNSVAPGQLCLLYTSDAADERSSVDLGGRRILKKTHRIQDEGKDNDRQSSITATTHELSNKKKTRGQN